MNRLVERSFTTKADPGGTWAHLSHVTAWPSWAHHIRRVTLDPPGALTPTSRGRLLLQPAVPTTFRVTALHAPHSWSWRGKFMGMTLDYDHRVQPLPAGGTRVTFTIDGSGATSRAVGPLFARVYGRILDRAIPHLVAELDALGAA